MNNEKTLKLNIKHVAVVLFLLCFSVGIVAFSTQIQALKNLGYFGVFLIMLLGNATLFLPVPILAPLNILFGGTLPNPLFVGLAAGLGSSLGEFSGYLAGRSGSEIITKGKKYRQIEEKVKKYELVAIFFLALIPNPFFDIGGLAAGALGIKWWKFLLATIVGKTIRTIILAYIGDASAGWVAN